MAKKKEKEIHEHTVEELVVKHEELSKKLYNLKNEYKINRKIDKPHLFNAYKKDIARVLTAIRISKNEPKGS